MADPMTQYQERFLMMLSQMGSDEERMTFLNWVKEVATPQIEASTDPGYANLISGREKLHQVRILNAPQIRPIERCWALLKSIVYIRKQMVCQHKRATDRQTEIVTPSENIKQSSIIKMFHDLPAKIKKAQADGLNTVL